MKIQTNSSDHSKGHTLKIINLVLHSGPDAAFRTWSVTPGVFAGCLNFPICADEVAITWLWCSNTTWSLVVTVSEKMVVNDCCCLKCPFLENVISIDQNFQLEMLIEGKKRTDFCWWNTEHMLRSLEDELWWGKFRGFVNSVLQPWKQKRKAERSHQRTSEHLWMDVWAGGSSTSVLSSYCWKGDISLVTDLNWCKRQEKVKREAWCWWLRLSCFSRLFPLKTPDSGSLWWRFLLCSCVDAVLECVKTDFTVLKLHLFQSASLWLFFFFASPSLHFWMLNRFSGRSTACFGPQCRRH